MASSISTTKRVTNGHDHPPEQQAAGVIESLVKAVKVLSCDESYQALGKVVEDNVSLKARNEEFECKTKEWDITKREMFATINTVQSEAKKAKALFSQKGEELQKSKEQEAELRETLGQSQKKVEDLKKELEANGVEISKTMKRIQDKEDEIRKLNVSLDKNRKDLKDCQKTASATQKELTEMREQYGKASQDLADLRGLAFPLTKVDSKSSAPAKLSVSVLPSMFQWSCSSADITSYNSSAGRNSTACPKVPTNLPLPSSASWNSPTASSEAPPGRT